MKAGQTDMDVATRVRIVGFKGEDAFRNGLIGTVSHPYAFGCTDKDWIGIMLDNGEKVNAHISEVIEIEEGVLRTIVKSSLISEPKFEKTMDLNPKTGLLDVVYMVEMLLQDGFLKAKENWTKENISIQLTWDDFILNGAIIYGATTHFVNFMLYKEGIEGPLSTVFYSEIDSVQRPEVIIPEEKIDPFLQFIYKEAADYYQD